MNTTHLPDLLWSKSLPNIRNDNLYNECLFIEELLKKRLAELSNWGETGFDTFTGRNYHQYNIFTLPSTQLMNLFAEIKQAVADLLEPGEAYMIQGWLNVFRENGFIDWHGHWEPYYNTIHGFYCVNVEDYPSFTEYKFDNIDITKVNSKNNLLVFGRSAGDLHRSSPGWSSPRPRITIAFDIIPVKHIQSKFQKDFIDTYPINHFIPFK